MEPIFLDLEAIQDIHEAEIILHGGSMGVRDQGLLESAVAMPRAIFGGYYLHEDLLKWLRRTFFILCKITLL
jgi:death-on-curing protein